MTFEEFESLSESGGKQELLDGELIELPPAKVRHMAVAKSFLELLTTVLSKSRVWFETGYQLGSSWLIPDISATWPDQRIANDYYQGGPMIAIEVESPGNTAEELDNSMLVHSRLDQTVIRVTGEYQTGLIPGLIVRLQDLLT